MGGAGGDGGDNNGNKANGGDNNSGDFSGNGGVAVGNNGNGGIGGDAIGGEFTPSIGFVIVVAISVINSTTSVVFYFSQTVPGGATPSSVSNRTKPASCQSALLLYLIAAIPSNMPIACQSIPMSHPCLLP